MNEFATKTKRTETEKPVSCPIANTLLIPGSSNVNVVLTQIREFIPDTICVSTVKEKFNHPQSDIQLAEQITNLCETLYIHPLGICRILIPYGWHLTRPITVTALLEMFRSQLHGGGVYICCTPQDRLELQKVDNIDLSLQLEKIPKIQKE